MSRLAKPILLGAALIACVAAPASAADFYEPPIVEAPPPVYYQPETPPPSFGGWYIRGDIDYHKMGWRGGDYMVYGPPPSLEDFDSGAIRPSFSVGGGVGYQVSKHFRVDATADWFFRSSFRGVTTGTTGCGGTTVCVDESSVSALLLMANAYADLGTWHKITPYVGAGIGGAHVRWDDLRNTTVVGGGGTVTHAGASSWRFAWALMAGASYCLTNKLKLDVGYRFARISGGPMFSHLTPGGTPAGSGPGVDRGFNVHEGRAGLRYAFGGGSGCGSHHKKEFVSYEPEPILPVYK